jgi:biopolymer transport protein ExbD
MRLSVCRTRPQLPTSPLASLALLLLSVVVVTGLFAASRGPGLRFATPAEAGAFAPETPVRVRVFPGGSAEVDGAEVAPADLAAAIAGALRAKPGAGALLVVSPDATYGDMLAAYGAAIAADPSTRVALPTRAWIAATATP